MPSVSVLQVLYRRLGDILLGWKPLLNTEAKSYKIYSCATAGGLFTLLKENIPNIADKTIYSGKVVYPLKDSIIPIPAGAYYYFKLTFVDPLGAESDINLSQVCEARPAGVEPFFENEDEQKNNHNMAWVHERSRWEKMLLTIDGRLKTDAQFTGSSLKVAARPDNTTLEYLLVDGLRRLIVRSDPAGITRIEDYEETIGVVPNAETDILTYTNTSIYYMEKITCSGTSDAVFKYKIDGTTKRTLRNSWNNRNAIFDFSTIAQELAIGSVLTITAKHSEVNNQDFEASLAGFTFTL